MARIFISYVREDVATVAALAKELQSRGIDVWYDRDSLLPGQRWRHEIKAAIARGDYFLACFSRAYAARSSTYMNEELALAIEQLRLRPTDRSWFIPALLDDCEIPDRDIGAGESLQDIQAARLCDDWAGGVARIVRVAQTSGGENASSEEPRPVPLPETSHVRTKRLVAASRLRFRIVVAASLILLGAIALGAVVARLRASDVEPGGPAAESGCADPQVAQLLSPFDTIELGVASGSAIPPGRWAAYHKMASVVVACARPGTRITIRPITQHAFTETPVFANVVPVGISVRGNPLSAEMQRRYFIRRAGSALDKLASIGSAGHGNDPLGALMAASRDISPRSQAVVVLIGSGWQQSGGINTFAFHVPPERFAPKVLHDLRVSHALPNLKGAHVILAGIANDASEMDVTDSQLESLCRFWAAVVEASDGNSSQCMPSLPGITSD